jgi:hypothetical protein
MRATILAAGAEHLGPGRLDGNSLKLNRVLRRFGVVLKRKAVLEDSHRAGANSEIDPGASLRYLSRPGVPRRERRRAGRGASARQRRAPEPGLQRGQ